MIYKRFYAGFIDFIIILFATIILCITTLSHFKFVYHYLNIKQDIDFIIFNILIFMVIGWLYFSLLESSNLQASLGKILFKYKIYNLNNKKISFLKSSLRYCFIILFGFLDLIVKLMGFNVFNIFINSIEKNENYLHDILTKTIVKKY